MLDVESICFMHKVNVIEISIDENLKRQLLSFLTVYRLKVK